MTLLFILSVVLNIELLILMAAGGAHGMSTTVLQEGKGDQIVAVYSIEDVIDGSSADHFRDFFRTVKEDEDIKAVVLRVNSPGGGVSASDRIYRTVRGIRADLGKPVVVSMGAVAASGGYYVSAGANVIYAAPHTMTGSIGVIAAWPVFKGLMDKHGVEFVTIRSSQARAWKAGENYWETPDERVRANVRDMLDEVHSKFEDIVRTERAGKLTTRQERVTLAGADGKTVTLTETEPLNGKVYLAEEAVELGLVDKIGYLEEAAQEAAGLASLKSPKIMEYSRKPSLWERLGASSSLPSVDARTIDRLTTPRVMMLWRTD